MHYHLTETQAVSLAEASCILGYKDPTTVLRMIASGQLQAFRAKSPTGLGAWRISRVSIAKLLEGQPQPVDGVIPDTPCDSPPEINSLRHQELGGD